MTKIDEAHLDEQQMQRRFEALIACIENLTKASTALLKRVEVLELHAKHQDQVRQFPTKEA